MVYTFFGTVNHFQYNLLRAERFSSSSFYFYIQDISKRHDWPQIFAGIPLCSWRMCF